MKYKSTIFFGLFFLLSANTSFAQRGVFDLERWSNVIDNIRNQASEQHISQKVIDETLKSPSIVPSIIKSDKNQTEFTLTLDEYLNRTVSKERVKNGRKKATE